MKICSKCKLEKNTTEFNKNSAKKDGLQSICRFCSNERSATHYVNNKISYRNSKKKSMSSLKEFVLSYLLEHPCIDCGETDPVVLEFDHVTDNKSRNIGNMIHAGVSVDSLKLEIQKCVIRCANCHRRKTAKQFGWFKLTNGPVV